MHSLLKNKDIILYALKRTGQGQTAIAKAVAVHKSTIRREFKRNRGERGYRSKQAYEKAITRRSDKVTLRIKESDGGRVDALVEKDWSPEHLPTLCMREVFRSVMSGFISISIKISNQGVITITSISSVRSRDQSGTEAMTTVGRFLIVCSSMNDHLLWI